MLRPLLKRLLTTVLPILILLAIAVYVGDYLSLRFSIPKREMYGSVEVREMYAVKLKSKQTEYMIQPPEQQECVNSLFGHFGDQPCWYLRRNPRQKIEIDSGQPHFFDR